jgi:hypothetical protein
LVISRVSLSPASLSAAVFYFKQNYELRATYFELTAAARQPADPFQPVRIGPQLNITAELPPAVESMASFKTVERARLNRTWSLKRKLDLHGFRQLRIL